MASTAGNAEDRFNFESQYRSSDEIKELNFKTADQTEWTMSEEWLEAKKKPRIYFQRLIFVRKNNRELCYSIEIEITSVKICGKGKIEEKKNTNMKKQRTYETSFIIPLSKFDCFEYSYDKNSDRETKHRVTLSINAFKDTFRYKVTISRDKSGDAPFYPKDKLLIFSEQIRSMLGSEEFSDVVLKAGQDVIKVHKNILSARSPVFKAMFQNSMPENRENSVSLPKEKMEVLLEMLIFMYSGVLRHIDTEIAYDLYQLADQYQVKDLRELCHFEMKRRISVANAVSFFVLTDTYSAMSYESAEEMRLYVLEFIVENLILVKMSDSWSPFEECHEKLVQEIEDKKKEIEDKKKAISCVPPNL